MSYKHFRIRKITVNKYKGARNVTLSRLSQFVIIVGPNGCGKSSLLEALSKTFTSNPDKKLNEKDATLSVDFERDAGESWVLEELKVHEGEAKQYDDVIGRYIRSKRGGLNGPPHDSQSRWSLIKQERESWQPDGANNVLSILAELNLRANHHHDKNSFKNEQESWKRACQVVHKLLKRELTARPNANFPEYGNYELLLDGELWVPNFLSDGEINILKMLFQAFAEEGEAEIPNLILIDEPELHLHPDNQRKFISLLKEYVKDRTQVFITTHSPYILSCFEPEEIRYISLPTGEQPQKVLDKGTEVLIDGLLDLLGGEEAAEGMIGLFSYSSWGITYDFLKQCFSDSGVVDASSIDDPEYKSIKSLLPKEGVVKLLDYGCGKGRIGKLLHDDNKYSSASSIIYHGYDIDEKNINDLKKHDLSNFNSVSFFCTIPAEEEYDVIIVCNLFHELPSFKDFENALINWKKHLKKGGKLLIIEDIEFRRGEYDFVSFAHKELETLMGKPINTFLSGPDNRIQSCVWISDNLPGNSTIDQYKEALKQVMARCTTQLGKIDEDRKRQQGKELAKMSRRHGFYLALLANAYRRL